MKSITALLLAAVLVLASAACAGRKPGADGPLVTGPLTELPLTTDEPEETEAVGTEQPGDIPNPQSVKEGWWWRGPDAGTGITYSVQAAYRNRTAASVDVKLIWTQSISSAFYGADQFFTAVIDEAPTGDVKIASFEIWFDRGDGAYTDSVTVETDWITVPAEATRSTLNVSAHFWAEPVEWATEYQVSDYWSSVIKIPSY